jgi:transcriptional regulator NrdR family protein
VKPSREVIIPRVRCPHCGADKPEIYKTCLPDADGDVRRYVRCVTCERTFHTIETDSVILPASGITAQDGKVSFQ